MRALISKFMFRTLLGFAALGLVAACQTTQAGADEDNTEKLLAMCGDFSVSEHPLAGIYVGEYEYRGTTLDHVLVVMDVADDGTVTAMYANGNQNAWDVQADCVAATGVYEDGTMHLTMPNGSVATYTGFPATDTIDVGYKKNPDAGFTTEGAVSRQG